MLIKIFNYEFLFFDNQHTDAIKNSTSETQWSVLRELREAQEASYTTEDETTTQHTLLSPQNKTL
ncbi:hypothetical protein PSCICJ_04800 [Pseudomonas cichorii]|nr:hypothetical protein PSCICJ_04800 [Pseudomonas cichorii]